VTAVAVTDLTRGLDKKTFFEMFQTLWD